MFQTAASKKKLLTFTSHNAIKQLDDPLHQTRFIQSDHERPHI